MNKKRVLGVTWDELPALAFNMLEQTVLPYPRGAEISKNALFSWLDEVFAGKVAPKTEGF